MGDPLDVDGEPADGRVDGDDWAFFSGSVTVEDDGYLVVLSDGDLDACDDGSDPGHYVSFFLQDLNEGERSPYISFLHVEGPLDVSSSASAGPVTVTDVGDDMIYGSIDHEHDGDNRVQGDFAARICDE
ncbi:MAG: hypothetical protein ACOCXM_08235 [Myxococcota bacterium]